MKLISRIFESARPSHSTERGASEFRSFAKAHTNIDGCHETIVKDLTAWCAENINSGNASSPGSLPVLRERLGYCGARARMFVDLMKSIGIDAQVFGIYTPGLRHTVVHARIDGREIFVDPQYGCLCKVDGGYLSFEQMRCDPDAAAAGLVFPVTGDFSSDNPAITERQSRARTLYSAAQIAKSRSYGFLRDERPVEYPLQLQLDDIDSEGMQWTGPADRIGFIESGLQLGSAPNNFFGATDKCPMHVWELQVHEATDQYYEIIYELAGFRGTVSVSAAGENVIWDAQTALSLTFTKDDPVVFWPLRFKPVDKEMTIRISANFEGWGRAVIIRQFAVVRCRSA